MKILYSYPEAADMLGLPSVQALRDLVYKRQGPLPTRIGRRVRFAHRDLVAWADSHRDAPVAISGSAPVRRRGRPTVAERQATGRGKTTLLSRSGQEG